MAVDMFLKFDDIAGESRDEGHKGWIEISSFSWGVNQTGTASSGGGGGAGKVSFQDLHITKSVDKSTPLLLTRCATGQHIRQATLALARTKNDRQTFMEYKLTDVMVSSFSPSCIIGPENTVPTDSFSLNFTKMEMVYREIDPSTNKVIGEHTASFTIKL